MTWREMPPPSVFERLAARGAEREFAERVERAFPIDPEALARVRSAVLAQVPASPLRALPSPRFRTMVSWQRGASVAMAVAVVAVAGAVMAGGRSGGSMVATGPGVERPAQAILLDRSSARLRFALATIQTSDAATIATMLTGLRADFLHVEAALHQPGADLTAAATSLRAQAGDLATMAVHVPAEDRGLFDEVTDQLTRIIATLPDPGHGGSTHPGGGNGKPNDNGNGKPKDNGGDKDKPKDHGGDKDEPEKSPRPDEKGKPDPKPRENGNGNGHPDGNRANGPGNGHAGDEDHGNATPRPKDQ